MVWKSFKFRQTVRVHESIHLTNVYETIDQKYKAMAKEVAERHKKGQPVLVGTTSILQSEKVVEYLDEYKLTYNLLNAKSVVNIGRQDRAGVPRRTSQWPPEMTHEFLQHEAADPGARVHGRQNEQSLEHDGEVIPQRHQPAPNALLKMWAMPTASDGAPPVRPSRVFSPTARRGHRSAAASP